VIDYTGQKQGRLPQFGLGGSLMNKLLRTAAVAALIAGAGALPAFAEDTIKVGVLVGYSGIGSLSGQQTDATIKLFQQKYGDAPGGHKIEFVRRDTTGPNPEVAKRLVQEVITREKVRIMIGPDFTPNTLAAAPIVNEAKVPTFVIGAATTGIIGEKSPYFTRTFFAIPQLCKPLASYAVKNNWKRVYVMVADFAPGHDCEKYFLAALAEAGGTSAGVLRLHAAHQGRQTGRAVHLHAHWRAEPRQLARRDRFRPEGQRRENYGHRRHHRRALCRCDR
jgi:ABC-type branched-subunit amino acid transport system substrate-binding protein